MKPPETWTITSLLRWSTDYFERQGIDSPRTTAELLLAHALQISRLDVYLRFDQPLLTSELATFKQLLLRRIKREPTAYIIGYKAFWSLELEVTPAVLIPRPDTECLVEQALARLPAANTPPARQVLELGTGSGAIILALARERPGHGYVASDRSPQALEVARRNAIRHHLHPHVTFFAGDWFAPLRVQPRFDLIVSNPPYVAHATLPTLQPEITFFEPLLALDGDQDGLAAIRHIIQQAPDFLAPDGWLLLEIGYDQKPAAATLARERRAYADIQCHRDYGGVERVLALRRSEE